MRLTYHLSFLNQCVDNSQVLPSHTQITICSACQSHSLLTNCNPVDFIVHARNIRLHSSIVFFSHIVRIVSDEPLEMYIHISHKWNCTCLFLCTSGSRIGEVKLAHVVHIFQELQEIEWVFKNLAGEAPVVSLPAVTYAVKHFNRWAAKRLQGPIQNTHAKVYAFVSVYIYIYIYIWLICSHICVYGCFAHLTFCHCRGLGVCPPGKSFCFVRACDAKLCVPVRR